MAALSLYRPCRVSFSPWGGQDLTMNFGTRLRCTRRAVSPLTFLFTRISREITSTPVFSFSLSLSLSLSLSIYIYIYIYIYLSLSHSFLFSNLMQYNTTWNGFYNLKNTCKSRRNIYIQIYIKLQFSLLKNIILYIWIELDRMIWIKSQKLLALKFLDVKLNYIINLTRKKVLLINFH